MKPLKFAIPALILATAGGAGAQSVTAEGGVSVDTESTVGESTGMGAEVTAQGDAEAGSDAAEGGLTVAAEAGADANGDVQLNEGTEILARDGVTIGSVAGIVDKAEGLFRVELDDAIEADVPAVVLSTETLTAVDGEVQVPMTGAEFSAALAQVVKKNQSATN